MTTKELAMHLITHSDEKPGIIDLPGAERIISYLDKRELLPDDLSPDELMKQWNMIIQYDPPEDIWS